VFEARYRKFVSIKDISIMNERIYGMLKVKHIIYFFTALIFVWSGLQEGRAQLLVLGCIVCLIGIISAFSKGSMSIEAKILMSLYSIFDSIFDSSSSGSRMRKEKIKQGKKNNIVVHLLAITIPFCSLAIYIAITSHIHSVYKFFVVFASILLIIMPLVLKK